MRKLDAKFSKCKFWLQEVTFLGHVVSAKETRVEPKKTKTMIEWKQLRNVSEIQIFLSLVGYYWSFVEQFSLITAPLTKLLCKNVLFVWSDEQQASFEKLKSSLTQTPILVQPESGRQFVVYSDASHVGLGYILT